MNEEMIKRIVRLYREGLLPEEEAESRLLELVTLPPEPDPPMPEGMIVPARRVTHTYHGLDTCVIGFNCISDGGLSADPAPAGKTFELTNDLGLKAVITMTDRCRGEGFIEGYTARKRKDPGINVLYDGDSRITALGINSCWDDDLPAFLAFPLWQDYFSRCRETDRKRRAYIRKTFLEDSGL